MDVNAKIIEAVKNYPLLYKGNATIEERQQGWEQLASEMKLHEKFLISRWHMLRKRYQCIYEMGQSKVGHFKYTKRMEFLLPYIRTTNAAIRNEKHLPESPSEPEFVITENDLGNTKNQEYVFLEVEQLEYNNIAEESTKGIPMSASEIGQHLDMQLQEVEYENFDQNTYVPMQTEVYTQHENVITSQGQEILNPILEEALENSTIGQEVVVKSEGISPTELDDDNAYREQSFTNEDNKPYEGFLRNSKNEKMPSAERCEDVIFGELVSAMLMHMSNDKKRSMKKKIMDLLLS